MRYIKLLIIFFFSLLIIGCKEEEKIFIQFFDEEELIQTFEIEPNSSLNLPNFTKEGYIFSGWVDRDDNEYSDESIFTKDLDLYAKLEPRSYVVTFVDLNNQTISQQTVMHGMSASSITAPALTGHTFKAWDQDFSVIKSDLTVKPIYEVITYNIIFLDADGNQFDLQVVEHGQNAVMPEGIPQKLGFIFIGWDHNFINITSNLTVYPVFTEDANGIIYELIDDYYQVIGYDGEEDNIIIPSTYNGVRVLKIGKNAFYENILIKNLTISEGITIIGERAFYGCFNLETVNLPRSIVEIQKEAFFQCSKLTKIDISAEIIGEAAFESCTSLIEVKLSDNLKTISAFAFYNCSQLPSIYIPDSVTSIGRYVFTWCKKLQKVYTSFDNLDNLKALLKVADSIYTPYVVEAIS